ncbi:MAG TPA: methylated-DNA--[protein]-cysteine S-methyltransferase [Burkholderiaceae bacterium]|nr:methylated-DNA--[protein]-cysteine S-methyltransferase [Burkholderiaceae bacterium]
MNQSQNLQYTTCQSPLGELTLLASDKGLTGMWFERQEHLPKRNHWQRCDGIECPAVLQSAVLQLNEYFTGKLTHFDLALDLTNGTAFQQSVWRTLLRIPFGHTTSYAEISQLINNPKAVRAVGGAIGRNPIGIIVPCHRVIGKDGSLTGYAGGLDRKKTLLRLESAL